MMLQKTEIETVESIHSIKTKHPKIDLGDKKD
jgi:hypothetical protein